MLLFNYRFIFEAFVSFSAITRKAAGDQIKDVIIPALCHGVNVIDLQDNRGGRVLRNTGM